MAPTRHQQRLVALILLAALVARWIAFTPFGVHHPDEAFQYLEQAYRLVFGAGMVPWEYRLGMRSWLLPVLLAGPMWLGDAIAPGTTLYMILPRALVALFAASAMWSAWVIGARVSRWHGLAAFAVIALWFESVFFSVHVLTETIAAACVLAAVALVGEQSDERTGAARLAGFGALLTLGVVMRFHYAPAIGVLALFLLRTHRRAWGWAAVGGGAVALVSSSVDLAMGQVPFGWIAKNFHQNVVLDRASDFGTHAPSSYPLMWIVQWRAALLLIVPLALLGARRFPLLMGVAVVNIAVHSFIGHKEYRFIWLSTQLVLLLAAIGTVDAVRFLSGRFTLARRRVAIGAGAIWLVASLALAPNSALLRVYGEDPFRLANQLSRAGACGIILSGASDYWIGGGRAFAHGGKPALYFVSDPADLAAMAARVGKLSPAADGILAPQGLYPLPPDYREQACGDDRGKVFCAYRRSGGCRPTPDAERFLLQQVMIRNDR